MPANTDPIYTRKPDNQWVTIPGGTAANTAVDGTGTVFTAYAADATNGSFLQRLRVKAAAVSAATVLRVFLNNGGSNATPENNVLIDEIALPAITGSNTSSVQVFDVTLNLGLTPGHKINVCLATSVTGPVNITGIGGCY
ncbi:hypothetical protein [Aquariibacter albus]|uniref:Uncharacterized protein n=1 Tax=Aquariibacter albus TaxID=2759899 RepID=A0A839HTX8_9BURK|nr:hypothetical protein [Aquariibacter albus]MBB1161464.1 hypothetical protein [Aquariibacter albus]